jgi:hypothetical protein
MHNAKKHKTVQKTVLAFNKAHPAFALSNPKVTKAKQPPPFFMDRCVQFGVTRSPSSM